MRKPEEVTIGDKTLRDVLDEHWTWLNSFYTRGKMAVLRKLDLSDVDLAGEKLSHAIIHSVDFTGCNLEGTSFRYATLYATKFSNTNLSYANFERAIVGMCKFDNVNFDNAKGITERIFDSCQMDNVKNVPHIPTVCPQHGSFIGYKKAYVFKLLNPWCAYRVLVTLEIPEDAKRSSEFSRKCGCDKAKVLKITDLSETNEYEECCSWYDSSFIYRLGETVTVDNFDENWWNDCSAGIHFFIDKQEAINY